MLSFRSRGQKHRRQSPEHNYHSMYRLIDADETDWRAVGRTFRKDNGSSKRFFIACAALIAAISSSFLKVHPLLVSDHGNNRIDGISAVVRSRGVFDRRKQAEISWFSVLVGLWSSGVRVGCGRLVNGVGAMERWYRRNERTRIINIGL
jgi:hypothetical protein